MLRVGYWDDKPDRPSMWYHRSLTNKLQEVEHICAPGGVGHLEGFIRQPIASCGTSRVRLLKRRLEFWLREWPVERPVFRP